MLAQHAGRPASSITVGDLVELWQRTSEHRTETAKTYAYALKHLPPQLAERKARDVRLIEIERIYRSLSTAGVGLHMIAKLQSALHTAYANGVPLGLVPSNPAAGARTPKIAKRATTMPTADVVAKVLGTV
jgi:site-specific recombinase XerC